MYWFRGCKGFWDSSRNLASGNESEDSVLALLLPFIFGLASFCRGTSILLWAFSPRSVGQQATHPSVGVAAAILSAAFPVQSWTSIGMWCSKKSETTPVVLAERVY